MHGRGSGDLLDAILAALPETPDIDDVEVGGPRRVAIVGKPNVGKSSLLNRLAGEERVVVDNVPERRLTRSMNWSNWVGGLAIHRHRRHPQAGA